MSDQVDITERMRAILVDWMVEVHVKFKLLTETMFLSVNLVDRFLSVKPITRTKLQLVGITAMLLASKYEEIYSPELRDFIHIADKAYTREEILRMERLMLTTLDFNLSASTPLHFLRRFSKASKSDSRTHTLSKYLSELTLTEYNMLKYLPSQIAASSVYIARLMTGRSAWVCVLPLPAFLSRFPSLFTASCCFPSSALLPGYVNLILVSQSATLEHYAQQREDDFIDCARDLNSVLKKALATGTVLHYFENSKVSPKFSAFNVRNRCETRKR